MMNAFFVTIKIWKPGFLSISEVDYVLREDQA